jgi:predicted alpha/beta superfamily hydrolase
MNLKQLVILFLLLFTSCLLLAQPVPEKIKETEFSIGKSIEIQSVILGETRVLNIYLPPHYQSDTLISYPVVYLLDGSKDEDFIHVAGIVQFGSFPWVNIIPESIVVGIANVDRKRDFTYPSQNKLDQQEFPTAGKSEDFIDFIEKELQPFIDATFRTNATKTIIGQSLGGLLVTEILVKRPDLFSNYIIVSPSLWWDDERLLDEKLSAFTTPKSIYIAGGKEGEVMERTAKELFAKLTKREDPNLQVFYEFLEDKTHGDALHIAVYQAFENIFSLKKE